MKCYLLQLQLGLVLASLLSGCATHVYHGSGRSTTTDTIRILMPPFFNATTDDHAARALTELTGTALRERRFPLYQTEELLIQTSEENAAGPEGRYAKLADTVGATHLLIGTVHEYRYKTDLDGDPAVGITLRLVDADTGQTAWQGSSSSVGYAFASLSSAAQKAVRTLVDQVPKRPSNHLTPSPPDDQ